MKAISHNDISLTVNELEFYRRFLLTDTIDTLCIKNLLVIDLLTNLSIEDDDFKKKSIIEK